VQTALSGYDWSSVKIWDVFDVNTDKAGTRIVDRAQTGFYQLAIKIGGYTETFYNRERIEFRDGSVVYLPKESRTDIDYHKTIIEQGKSICIFFNSDMPLPPKPMLIRCGDAKTVGMFTDLNKAFNAPENNYFDYIGIFYNIISQINRALAGETIHNADKMSAVIGYMKENLNAEYADFDRFAQSIGMSREGFRHKFKRLYGMAPLQYYHSLKTGYIKAQICENRYTLGQIAQLSGFSSLNYFSRFFKKNVGMTPTEYKRMLGLSRGC